MFVKSISLFVYVLIPVFFAACEKKEITLFTTLTSDETGIDFVNQNVETETVNILTYEYFYNGGGVAIGDVNNDGLPDIYFSSNNESNKLYLNKGDLEFDDITTTSGTTCGTGWKTGVCMADVNGDGWLDIYVSRSGQANPENRRNILLINNKDLTFTDRAKEFGLDDDSFSTQASFFDHDRDGDLDVLVLNHSLLSISNSYDISLRNTTSRHAYVGNRFYLNQNGHFIDVSDSIGIYGPASNYGLGISVSDVNDDGWPDVYTGSDYMGRDKLLINRGGKAFEDETLKMLSHISKFTMGTDIADVNNDGLMDIYSLDMLPESNKRQKQLMGSDRYDMHSAMVRNGLHYQYMRNMLHINRGDGTFSEVGQLAGVSNTDWSWSALFADYDNDGFQDLFVSNGFKRDLTDNDFAKFNAYQEIMTARRAGKQIRFVDVIEKFKENKIPNYIFQGSGNLTFADQTKVWGLDQRSLTNGAAYADLDNDGDLDLVTNNINEAAGIFRNNAESATTNHFIKIVLSQDSKSTTIGSKVTVYAKNNQYVRELIPTRGFQSSVDFALHFGLGDATTIDSVVVRWPSGEIQKMVNISSDQILTIKYAPSRTNMVTKPKATLFTKENALTFVHQENVFNDFNTQPLLPWMFSTQGPALACGDVNNDGLIDVFVGGAKDQTAQLMIQTVSGSYKSLSQRAFMTDRAGEDVDAVFLDIDGDKDSDLYVVSGGYEFFLADTIHLQDRLYENDGHGNFKRRSMPQIFSSGSCARPCDIDNDGDVDLFVGSRVSPGRYPEVPSSYILLNDGKGNYSVKSSATSLMKDLGMVTDAVWTDMNGDHQPDLIVVGEWTPVQVLINSKGELSDQTLSFFKKPVNGLWNCITAGDFDQDGDMDFVAGNFGLNSQMRASDARPVKLAYSDFDNNGSVDPLLNYSVGDETYPYPSRDELVEQIPSFKKRFTSYAAYSTATLSTILTPEELALSRQHYASNLETVYITNNNGTLDVKPFPIAFQSSPVYSLVAADLNKDGNLDVIAAGNLSGTRARTGKLTGNSGFVALGDGKGNFTTVQHSGLTLSGDVRGMILTGRKLIVAINDAPLETYEMH